jgi:hypothetical protein
MDLPVQNLRGDSHGNDQAVRPGGAAGSLDAFSRAEEDFFHVAPLAEVEDHLQRLQALMTKLALKARTRRQSEMAEKCAICGNPWKHRLPDGGRVPVGIQFWHMEDGTTINLYACDGACFSKLQYQVEKRTYQIRKDRDDLREAEHQEKLAAKRPPRRGL